MKRVGVFLCWCGSNIAGVVDMDRLQAEVERMPGVVHVEQNKYTCSDPGQESIRRAIREHRLQRVVVAACSPRMHERTFRAMMRTAGLNPYLLEMANLREHCSWVHRDIDEATAKAVDLVRRAVFKVRLARPLQSGKVPITRRALVLGGGIAGIQAALDLADFGIPVVLVESSPSLGGRMAQLDKTFPTLDCSSCILTPKMVEVATHPSIRLLTYSEVESVEGYVGNFKVLVRRKARSVDEQRCTGCGECLSKCPAKVPSEFDLGLGTRGAIYVPFPQAVPNVPVIDRQSCLYFTRGRCRICQRACPAGAIDYQQEDRLESYEVGAIVVATGYDQFDPAAYGEYAYRASPNVITGLEFERLVSSTGPTGGRILTPGGGREPQRVVFIKCVGSRDEQRGASYCSKTCCMYVAKQAILLKEKLPRCEVYVFYMDVRAAGKDYEEFYLRAREMGVQYVRGRVARVFPHGDRLRIRAEDTLIGRRLELEADLVVLASAMVPRPDARQVARKLGIAANQHGFFSEAHPKLRPVETHTAGIFLAGAAQGPKDIPDSVAQAGAAASKAAALLSRQEMETEPVVAEVNEHWCSGCLRCARVCPYNAISEREIRVRTAAGVRTKTVATVNPGLCQGCGACAVACRDGAMNLAGFADQQVLAEVDALCL